MTGGSSCAKRRGSAARAARHLRPTGARAPRSKPLSTTVKARVLIVLLLATLPPIAGCEAESRRAQVETLSEQDSDLLLAAHLPDWAPDGWQAVGPTEEYTPASLFEYINGGAAFYLGYAFSGCAVRRYESAGQKVTVELYDMGSPADAYGVFHWDLASERPPVGDGACYEAGLLKLWTGRFFLRLLAEREQVGTLTGLTSLAQAVTALLPGGDGLPGVARRAEDAGLAADSLRYFHRLETLNAIRYYDAWQHLGLAAETEAIWGELPRGGEALVIWYPTAEAARRAASAAREALERESADVFAITHRERMLVVVLGMDEPVEAEAEASHLADLI